MIRYILTDIEGTTTSISFVHDVLFPYAAAQLSTWVQAHLREPKVREALEDVKTTVLSEQGNQLDDAGAIEQLLAWIKADRKHTALKAIQGWIWKEGYESRAYTSHVYPDVKPALERWKQQGLQMGVYSSGSVEAQIQLFGHTSDGDLRPYFSHHFDTHVGHKREVGSYKNIQSQLGIPAGEILFLSDIPEELDAAKAAGYAVLHLLRPGTEKVERYEGVEDFGGIII